MKTSCRSKTQYLPRFPRIQLLLRRREQVEEEPEDEADFRAYVDADYMVQIMPQRRKPKRVTH